MDGEDSKKEQNIGGTVGRNKGLITLLRIRVVMQIWYLGVKVLRTLVD